MATATAPEARAHRTAPIGALRRFWDSSIGKKIVMAVTGVVGIAFLIGHMAGNLQMFTPGTPAQAMHDYAVGLRALGPLLWIARIGLVIAVVLHVTAALQLTLRNRAARPVPYALRTPQVSTLGARTMRIGGVLLLLFIIFHIADMTYGVGHPQFVHLDPYNNLRIGFQRWWAVAFYLVAIVFVGLHLYHGVWSSWRTMGARRPSDRPHHRTVAIALVALLTLGFAAVPIAAALGMFGEDLPLMESETVQGTMDDAPVVTSPTGGER
jgi:succinate dehydrogenase / fumarate reductase cytochrome b subunit